MLRTPHFWKGIMPTASNPKHPNNEWYEELCALAAIGELSSEEFRDLEQHLAGCRDCREIYIDFRRISADDMGLAAVLKRTEHAQEEPAGPLDAQELLSRLLDRAKRERETRSIPSTSRPDERRDRAPSHRLAAILHWLRRPALSYGTVALLLCAGVAIGAYRLREAQLLPTLAQLRSQLNDWKSKAETTAAEEKSASQLLDQNKSEREALWKSLAEAQAKYAALEEQQKALESELATTRARLGQVNEDAETSRANAEDKAKQLAQLEARVENAVRRTEEQERIAEGLRTKLQWAETPKTAPAPPPGVEDVDAKNLFGARDLHIVDVYDVDSSGTTKRTYGRVYYAEKKLLIFYAFDLLDKKHNRAAAGFQAWGYRQPSDGKPESLGLFDVDDTSANRWVLKVNNPRVLERIDAVFVTLEPPNGSPSPRGRRLLYANLAGPANHP
jgi:hypothetical protein